MPEKFIKDIILQKDGRKIGHAAAFAVDQGIRIDIYSNKAGILVGPGASEKRRAFSDAAHGDHAQVGSLALSHSENRTPQLTLQIHTRRKDDEIEDTLPLSREMPFYWDAQKDEPARPLLNLIEQVASHADAPLPAINQMIDALHADPQFNRRLMRSVAPPRQPEEPEAEARRPNEEALITNIEEVRKKRAENAERAVAARSL